MKLVLEGRIGELIASLAEFDPASTGLPVFFYAQSRKLLAPETQLESVEWAD